MKLVKKNCNGDGEILLFSFEWAFLSLHISPVIQVVSSANKYEGFPPVNKN